MLALPKHLVPRCLDPIALDQYLAYGYVPQPRTMLNGIYKLPPAHFAVWHDGSLSIEPYWQPDWNHTSKCSIESNVEELQATLGDAVREQMISDVPLGAFLSGGIDSTIIVGLMQKMSNHRSKDIFNWLSRSGVQRNGICRAGRAPPGHGASVIYCRTKGLANSP